MTPNFYTLPLLFLSFIFTANSIHFQIPHFDSSNANIIYQGSAAATDGGVNFNINKGYHCQVGRAIYSKKVLLWDSNTGQLTDFTTNYTFIINTMNTSFYGDGLAFFLAPFGILEIPPNSSSGFFGLFNTTTKDSSSSNQIVHVEFDSYPNDLWGETTQHVGINNNSIISSVSTPWNASYHSGDTAQVSISYNSTTKNLTVSWKYQTTSNSQEKTSLSYQIDLMKVLPEWITVGFSASTGEFEELNNLLSWEFNSTLDKSNDVNSKETKLISIVTISCGVFVLGVVVFVAFVILKSKRKRSKKQKEEAMHLTSMNDDLERGAGPRRFNYKELYLATNKFSKDKKLGEGGFGAVFKGYFYDLDLQVAVKKISSGSRQGKKEYVIELVKLISQLRHRNLVKLLGWCHEKGELLLVYEFMPNGSLDSHLFGKKTPLSWSTRHKIVIGLASGLLYLHEEWERCVVHRDIKSSNVMLDSSFNVKIGDFGLAKLMDHELGPQTTGLAGTFGYIAPEYVSTGRASKESDVYSFGIVVMEITTGKKATAILKEKYEEKGMIEWVWDHYGRGELLKAMDENLKKDYDEKEVECLMIVGLWCAHPDVNLRPSIRQAIQVLNFEVSLPNLPPNRPIAICNL